jgi:Na+-transporting NADH:ubiquinone oxidoreductase subunit C
VASKNSVSKTFLVAFALCLVCSIIVSTAAVLLKDMQAFNVDEDKKRNILQAAGLYQEDVAVEEQFSRVNARLIDLRTGKFSTDYPAESFDQRKSSKDPERSSVLSSAQDIAKISRRGDYAVIYLVESELGLDKIILPVKGYALWSTLYGFLALDSDANTVAGLGFYEHKETPGLGGEIDNPSWKALWPGKQVYRDGDVALQIIKGSVDTSRAGSEYQIDGLSGATLTSRGVDNLVSFWMGNSGYGPFLRNLRAGEA